MKMSVQPSNMGRAALKFIPTPATGAFRTVKPVFVNAEVAFFDLSDQADWTGAIDVFSFDLPKGTPHDFQIEFDWIRLEGALIENESFEYWDLENQKIAAWTASAAYDFPDFMDPNQVNSRDYGVVVTGTGNSESITQDIRDGLDLPKGQRMLVEAALLVPADANGTTIAVNVSEQGTDGQWSAGTAVAVDTLDAYSVISAECTLALEPADRTGLRVEVAITNAAGTTVYLDDVFVNTLPELREPAVDAIQGWPINCVKLSEGQTIIIDGVVTPEEYAGAQAVVINAETAYGIDPHDPIYTHSMSTHRNTMGKYKNGINHWAWTPLDDYNGTYYIMWDAENFYIACSVEDDSYAFKGPVPSSSDGLQFTLAETIFEGEKPYCYIPTVSPGGADGQPVAQNAFNADIYYDYDLFQHPETEYACSVNAETNDWTVELKIPFRLMVGDFKNDLADSDRDGDGKDVFPPEVGDVVGFAIVVRDWDMFDGTAYDNLAGVTTHTGFSPWQNFGTQVQQTSQPLTFVGAPDTTSGLVAHWKLDEGQGDVATDSSGNEHQGTYVASPVLGIAGASGTCMDSSAGWMEADLGSDLPVGAAERTVSLWINPTDVNEIKFFNYGAAGKGTDFAFAAFPGAGILQRHGGGYNTYAGDVELNEWTHLAMVVPLGRTMTSDVQVYINGVNAPQEQGKGAPRALDTQVSPCYVGTCILQWRDLDGDGVPSTFVGMIDDVRIYNRALSPADLAAVRAGD